MIGKMTRKKRERELMRDGYFYTTFRNLYMLNALIISVLFIRSTNTLDKLIERFDGEQWRMNTLTFD